MMLSGAALLVWSRIPVGADYVLSYRPALDIVLEGGAPWGSTSMPFVDPVYGALIWWGVATPLGAALLSLGAVTLGAWLMDVRGSSLMIVLSYPVLGVVASGNNTAWLVLAQGVAWRFRGQAWTGIVAALACSVKPWLGSLLLLWMVSTRQWGSLLAALGVGLALLSAWLLAAPAHLGLWLGYLPEAIGVVRAQNAHLLVFTPGMWLLLLPALGLWMAAKDRSRLVWSALAVVAASPIVWSGYLATVLPAVRPTAREALVLVTVSWVVILVVSPSLTFWTLLALIAILRALSWWRRRTSGVPQPRGGG